MILEQAERIAQTMVEELAPFCVRIEIAGSIRRRRAEVGDIDLVCIPKGLTGRAGILARCNRAPNGRMVKEGEQYVVFEYQLPAGFPLQLDLWFAHQGGSDMFNPDPSNWGMLLLARTGSAMHNVWLAQRAKERGLRFNPHRGILKGDAVLASETEQQIFTALGCSYIQPERRER